MRFKNDGIDAKGLQPQVVLALLIANEVYKEYDTELVITSLADSKHSWSSLHYAGAAVDLRTHNLPSDQAKKDVANKIQEKLNVDFDVILEPTHIHLEWQPKYRPAT